MALKVTINAEGGGIVIQNVGKANELYLVGLEDIRLSQKDATDIQVELENPEHLIQTVLDTSAGEVSINGNVSASPAAAIADFGAVVEAARSAGGGGGGDATAANQVTQIGLETTIRDNTNNLDVLQSTRSAEATQLLIKAKTDNLDIALSLLSREATLDLVKTAVEAINTRDAATFDRKLSELLQESTFTAALDGKKFSDLAQEATLSLIKVAIDSVKIATEGTQANTNDAATQTTLALIKAKTDNLDVLLSTLETTLNAIETNTAASGGGFPVGNTGAITTVANSATSVVLLSANPDRESITIVNRSNQNFAVAFAATATTTDFTIWLPKRGGDEYSQVTRNDYTGIVSGIWAASGDRGATITEVTQV